MPDHVFGKCHHDYSLIVYFLYADVVVLVSLVCLFLRYSSVDNPTVKMSILFLSLIFVFLQSLTLDYKLLMIYTYMKYAIVSFVIVRINLFITKLL